eukprot:2217160-Lingulodinium_polyedra.AAC.1
MTRSTTTPPFLTRARWHRRGAVVKRPSTQRTALCRQVAAAATASHQWQRGGAAWNWCDSTQGAQWGCSH